MAVGLVVEMAVGVSVDMSVEVTVGVLTTVGAREGYQSLLKLSVALVLRDQHHSARQVKSAIR